LFVKFNCSVAQMKVIPNSEPFGAPVDETAIPNYRSKFFFSDGSGIFKISCSLLSRFCVWRLASTEARFKSSWNPYGPIVYCTIPTGAQSAVRQSDVLIIFGAFFVKSMPTGLKTNTEPPIILPERRLTSIARTLAGLGDTVEHRDIFLECRGVFVSQEFGVSGWLAG